MIDFIQTDVGGMAWIQFPWESFTDARTLHVKAHFHNWSSSEWLFMGFYTMWLRKWERNAA